MTYTCDLCGAPATERRIVYRTRLPYTTTASAYDSTMLDLCAKCVAKFDAAMDVKGADA